ncbi:MAG: dihydropteroate synthase [Caldilineaceae bacterium]|nr:dihydropteroate synthase [Caldilineaceae bacterium]
MPDQHTVYLALGTNLGDRAANLYAALDALRAFAAVDETAFLYETPPAYVLDQPAFLNTVCRIRTALSPTDLLAALKSIENQLGRQETIRFGPRVIDLDILFYDDLVLASADLAIPHARLAERDFVLEPLCDLDPELRHPQLDTSVRMLWQRLKKEALARVMPTADRLWQWGAKTYVMGIINVTPDSFTGDGLAEDDDRIARAVAQAQRFAAEGADFLDVGGYSTRPNHEDVPIEEEIRRVVPVIRALRENVDLPISIDTFRTPVGAAALDAGAHWINDVWGLRLFPDLADLAVRHHAPLVVMHNRFQPLPAYHNRLASTPGSVYTDLLGEIRQELAESLSIATRAGLPRWLQIIDPGIGFGKTLEQHMELINRLDSLKAGNYPLLFGASRKGFIGAALGGLPADQRLEGTLAANVLAVDRGADIVRVHDVAPTVRAVRMADAITRR